MNFNNVQFLLSVFATRQLPEENIPEVAFAGRSNVGKSSLINRLIGRANLVKTSSKPGKTQSLNYFSVDGKLFLVDLPGYGFAKVSKDTRNKWQTLISSYLQNREQLSLVVVIVDLRHEVKTLDRDLVDWLRYHAIPYVIVYTKADKLSKNKQVVHAAALDAGLAIKPEERFLFSSKTGKGCTQLRQYIINCCLAGTPGFESD